MLNVFLTASVSFVITFLTIPVIMKVAEQKKLYDLPDSRKLHTKPIASLGGIGIFGGFFLAALLAVSGRSNPEFQYFFASALVVFFLGLKDDIIVISPTKKFVGQLVAAAILIHLGGLRIQSMHGLFGYYELPEAFSLALSYATIIVVTNAFNLIDGIDGLAGSLGLLTMCVFGAFFFMNGLTAYSILAFAMAGSLFAFLIFNYNPAKIFMGDSGSLLLGLINAILVIKFITIADSKTITYPVESAVAVGFSILMVPLADTLRVFSIRIVHGRSPFSPDRNHIHHLLLDRGLNHKYVTASCLILNVLFISMAYFGRSLGPNYVFASMATVCFTLLFILFYHKKPVKNSAALDELQQNADASIPPTTKVVPLNIESAVAEN
ncbi:MAG: undecaprenyl/decaprenyl-phosphate alpha-N-acetylglucosaminyl 1-phosphate transferase [Chitinophagaceae bacterium]|nr:undecaprenyl/decaprenyl-phosphate alpha-N-acetylglucosaminyl 1-phosphate transferase [Chitinophagaceae bacterium]